MICIKFHFTLFGSITPPFSIAPPRRAICRTARMRTSSTYSAHTTCLITIWRRDERVIADLLSAGFPSLSLASLELAEVFNRYDCRCLAYRSFIMISSLRRIVHLQLASSITTASLPPIQKFH